MSQLAEALRELIGAAKRADRQRGENASLGYAIADAEEALQKARATLASATPA